MLCVAMLPPAEEREVYLGDPQNLEIDPEVVAGRKRTYHIISAILDKTESVFSGKRQKKHSRKPAVKQSRKDKRSAHFQAKGYTKKSMIAHNTGTNVPSFNPRPKLIHEHYSDSYSQA